MWDDDFTMLESLGGSAALIALVYLLAMIIQR